MYSKYGSCNSKQFINVMFTGALALAAVILVYACFYISATIACTSTFILLLIGYVD